MIAFTMVMCITRVQVAAHSQCGVHDEADTCNGYMQLTWSTCTRIDVCSRTSDTILVLFIPHQCNCSCSDRNKSGYIAIS